jgi:hypothetical protein
MVVGGLGRFRDDDFLWQDFPADQYSGVNDVEAGITSAAGSGDDEFGDGAGSVEWRF